MEEKTKKINPKKVEAVTKIKEKLEKAKAFFLADYQGLTHLQLESLKKALKKVEGEFFVVKNTLFRLALEKIGKKELQPLEKELKNPTAAFFIFGEEIPAIKEMANFIKGKDLPKIKIGFFAGQIASPSDFAKLAAIPPRETLLSLVVAGMKSPLYRLYSSLNWNLWKLVFALDKIKEKKQTSN